MKTVTIVGAGLAGCEAALQCARRGVAVRLMEMRPARMTDAHETGDVAEVVCSNSLKSEEPQNAHGLLKAELRLYGSALLECADRARIPGGKALVVDRRRFSAEVQKALDRAGVTVERSEVCSLPWSSPYRSAFEMSDPHQPTAAAGVNWSATPMDVPGNRRKGTVPGREEPAATRDSPRDFPQCNGDVFVVATGPLTSAALAESLQMALGAERLFFYDAIAPIVATESLDRSRIFEGSRYGAGDVPTEPEFTTKLALSVVEGTPRHKEESLERVETGDQIPVTREAEGKSEGPEQPKSEVRSQNSEVRSEETEWGEAEVRSQSAEGRSGGIANPAYLNCPMTEEEYERFVTALLEAELHPLHEFEKAALGLGHNPNPPSRIGLCPSPQFFEGCLPVEEIARRGKLALAFGPMKPVGLEDPRTGKRPFAVVQLRRENETGTMWNLVGFQTRLKHPEQVRVFRLIPGLEKAEFLRLGSIHRNTYLDAPAVLLPTLQARTRPELFVAGQLTGVEGYVESIGAGLVAGVNAARLARGEEPVELPTETMLGSLLGYIAGENQGQSPAAKTRPRRNCSEQHGTVPVFRFQPMNANFGLLPPLPKRMRGREKRAALAERALEAARRLTLTIMRQS